MSISVGQLFFVGIQGPALSPAEADFLVKNDIGGVVLFARNLTSPQELHKLCGDIQNLRSKTVSKAPFFIAIDMEGGRVHRLKPPFTQWPSLAKVSNLDSTSMAYKSANIMAEELRAVGINLDFAPCVDVLTNPDNKLIGDRSLGSDPEQVAKMASALVRGYIKGGVIACAKHFPGHGNTIVDSHEELPVDSVDPHTLESRELVPFKKVFRSRIDMVMTAHIKYEKIDPENPATLSPIILQKILREGLRYRGLVISDDLDMKALAKYHSREEIAVQALKAGCDMLLYCNDPSSPPIALESVRKALADGRLSEPLLTESLHRVAALKKESLSSCLPLPMSDASKVIGHPEHLRVAKAINDGVIPEDLRNT